MRGGEGAYAIALPTWGREKVRDSTLLHSALDLARCRFAINLAGGDHRLGAAGHSKLQQDGRDMGLHRCFRNVKSVGDLLVEKAFLQHQQDADLLRRERGYALSDGRGF